MAGVMVWPEFFDPASLLLTVGGAIGVTCFSYSSNQLVDLLRAIRALFPDKSQSVDAHMEELARLTRLYRLEGLRGLEGQERHLADSYLRNAVAMLVDLNTEAAIYARLERQTADALRRQEISRQILLTVGRSLPSFGLIGTLMGLVLLLKNVAGENMRALPAALSLAILTTLYGAVLANVVVAPIAARLHAKAVENETKMRLTSDWVRLLLPGQGSEVALNRLSAPSSVRAHARGWKPLILLTER
jgi:chemotaxis protein MotA